MSQAQVGPGRGQPPSIPRWVTVFGIIAIVLVVGFVILHLTGHGFGNHAMPMGGQPLPTSLAEQPMRTKQPGRSPSPPKTR